MATTFPSRDELMSKLQAALQENDPHRPLDSIEVVTVQAVLAGYGIEWSGDITPPRTIVEWVEWVVRF